VLLVERGVVAVVELTLIAWSIIITIVEVIVWLILVVRPVVVFWLVVGLVSDVVRRVRDVVWSV